MPPKDAAVVTKLRAAGAVILGKTNMPDFAGGNTTRSTSFGRTGNAYDVRFSPGGSSGGTVDSRQCELRGSWHRNGYQQLNKNAVVHQCRRGRAADAGPDQHRRYRAPRLAARQYRADCARRNGRGDRLGDDGLARIRRTSAQRVRQPSPSPVRTQNTSAKMR